MKKIESRPIESFELKKGYYKETWINGNKKHVAEELSELFLSNMTIAISIITELPKDIQKFVLESEAFKNANLKISIALIKR